MRKFIIASLFGLSITTQAVQSEIEASIAKDKENLQKKIDFLNDLDPAAVEQFLQQTMPNFYENLKSAEAEKKDYYLKKAMGAYYTYAAIQAKKDEKALESYVRYISVMDQIGAEKAKIGQLKKDGASAEEIAASMGIIKELAAELGEMKKAKLQKGDWKDKKGDWKGKKGDWKGKKGDWKDKKVAGDDEVSKVWNEMLTEKKKYGEMAKNGASAEELAEQKNLIKSLYEEVLELKGKEKK